jgi:hypothetical protein
MTEEQPIVRSILISEAAVIVENAFRDVLGMSARELAGLSPDHKFGKYCDEARLRGILDYVHDDRVGGLPAMQPPRTIFPAALSGITTDSAIRLLIRRITDFAFYYV